MKIVDVVCCAGRTGFYFDDQRAIKNGAAHDGFTYLGEAVTDGFRSVRQAGESISVMLILEDGQVAFGDCAAVQYSGAGGRDQLFLAEDFIPVIEKYIAPKLIGRELNSFKDLAKEVDQMEVYGKRLHTAIRYGVTQAILDAVAKAKKVTMAEIVRDEYNTGVTIKRVPIFTQSGDDRYDNVDKMIIKGADVMPHALINNVEDKLGKKGEKLLAYVKWLRDRVLKLRTHEEYNPIFHIDVYGTIGMAFNNDVNAMVQYMKTLEEAVKPFHLRIEGPVDVEDREKQMEALKNLRSELDKNNVNVEIVADEWCNTYDDVVYFADNKAGHMLQIKTPDLGGINNIIEAILYCKKCGIGAYCGGTCNETNRSAEICTNIAMGCGADQCLAKPGMGVDEGYMIVNNEMNRVTALANRRNIKQINVQDIVEAVKKMCIEANYYITDDIKNRIKKVEREENWPIAKDILNKILTNADIAQKENMPMCQDTGMACVFVEIGQEVHIVGGSLKDAINEGVRQGYKEGYLRKSVVKDPLDRVNTGDNTPAVINYDIVPGNKLKITIAPKGFGSENMSKIKMLKPSDGIEGVKKFVVETVKEAGPNPCPPTVIGVGIGGTFDKVANLAKRALIRPVSQKNENSFYAELEAELLDSINKLGIGPQGFGGKTTALAVNIETYPTHIAGLPVAVNINCHATRHAEIEL